MSFTFPATIRSRRHRKTKQRNKGPCWEVMAGTLLNSGIWVVTRNGNYISNHYSVDDPTPVIQDFVKRYKAKYNGTAPDAIAAWVTTPPRYG